MSFYSWEITKAFYGGVLGLASDAAKDGNLVQASFVVNRDQHVELTKGAAGTGGSYLVEKMSPSVRVDVDTEISQSLFCVLKGATQHFIQRGFRQQFEFEDLRA